MCLQSDVKDLLSFLEITRADTAIGTEPVLWRCDPLHSLGLECA